MAGIEFADSFNTNPNKWLLVNFDCSCLWVRCRIQLTSALVVDPLYLQHANSDEAIDYRHWGIPLSRRFRSLKLWFVMRKYGISGLQKYIRNHIELAKQFEKLVRCDRRFEVVNDVKLGLVCFRLLGPDSMNQTLLASINASGKLHMIPSMVRLNQSLYEFFFNFLFLYSSSCINVQSPVTNKSHFRVNCIQLRIIVVHCDKLKYLNQWFSTGSPQTTGTLVSLKDPIFFGFFLQQTSNFS